MIALLSLGLITIVTLLYPLINFPMVQGVAGFVTGTTSPPTQTRAIISVVALLACLVLDTTVKQMGLVFGLAGSLGLGLLAYVLPAAAFLTISRNPAIAHKLGNSTRMATTLACIVLIVGLVMTIGSTGRILYSAFIAPPQ